MIGDLPESLYINGTEYEINTDFRIALLILEATADKKLTDQEKACVILLNLFCDEIPDDDIEEALKEAAWFLDGGDNYDESPPSSTPLISWKQDERHIFSAVNKVAGHDVRTDKHLHWWSFLSSFSEIGDGMLAQIVNVRRKQSEGKPLDKTEKEFYQRNKSIIDIREDTSREYLEEIKEEKERLNRMIGVYKRDANA